VPDGVRECFFFLKVSSMINPDDNFVIIHTTDGQTTIMSVEDFNSLPVDEYPELTDEEWEQSLRERAIAYC
jgi:hypothetical protein